MKAVISAAFSAAYLEGAHSLRHTQLRCEGTDDGSIANVDQGRHWSAYDIAELEACTAALVELEPIAWRFYLPAYLLAALKKVSTPIWETGLPGAVLFNLDFVDDDSVWSRRQQARFATLSRAQREAVRLFLAHVANASALEPLRNSDARRALAGWWAGPLAGRLPSAGVPAARSVETSATGFPRIQSASNSGDVNRPVMSRCASH